LSAAVRNQASAMKDAEAFSPETVKKGGTDCENKSIICLRCLICLFLQLLRLTEYDTIFPEGSSL
jgi:hypothetical protein